MNASQVMNPCSGKKKLIAWLALDALSARESAELRDHLKHCEACRHYWEELTSVAHKLASAAPDSSLEASERFYRRVAQRLQIPDSDPFLGLAARVRAFAFEWRVAVSAFAVLVLALTVLITLPGRPPASGLETPTAQLAPAAIPETELAPTIANYQRIVYGSPEELDELLTRQGNKRLPQTPAYTISGLQLANATY